MKRVLIAGGGTGGHLMPALGLAEALVRLDATVEPVLVGAERGVEADLLPTRPYRHYLLPAEPIYRRAWWRNLRWPLVLWRLLRRGARVLAVERPALAVSTGGYAAGSIMWQAVRRGVPLAIQEQNAYPGVTARRLARHARQIHLGFPEARSLLAPGRATEVYDSGNPIVPPPDPRPDPAEARAALGLPPEGPVVLVVGGSQGALSVNRAVAGALETGALEGVSLLWSTGKHSWERYRNLHAPPGRHVRAFWDPIGEAYAAADLVVARSGAMTTAELLAWGLPAILVPLPRSAANHQYHNALAVAAAGAALHVPDRELRPDRLAAEVRTLLDAPDRLRMMGRAAAARGRPKAAEEIAKRLLAVVS